MTTPRPRPVVRAQSVTMINADGSTDLFTPAVHLEQMTTDRDYWQELAGQRREQVRTLEADLIMCREQLAQESDGDCLGHLTDGCPDAQLPEPDHTNPAHGDFVRDWIGGVPNSELGGGEDGEGPGERVREAVLDYIDRLEAAQQQADSDEELIEKAAKVIAVDSPPDALDYETARNLLAANLLRDGDRKAKDDGEAPFHRGISNGQLLAMDSDRRAEVIASLSPEVRRQLANIASLGASRLISQVIAEKDDWRAGPRLASAREFTDLAANLLRDGGEK
ncbi:hypothetical protein [Gordonia sp. N1V]|uniref:hypothetical protein n=1 Tax=Gordonia sp. N1V TaxID=3034163 RepID=UPI0023E33280|nr:hypothetical protein [Gordonia sp. N1V]MDF3280454.1 hypothetical protein [Gordonia sp. N1V]